MPRRRKTVTLIILQETQTIVTLLVALGILHLRTAHSIYYALGATAAAVFAKCLKKVIKQPRPTKTVKKTYGMPSTHSASIGFLGTYLTLCCLFLRPHPSIPLYTPSRHSDMHMYERSLLALASAGLMCSVWWSRVKLGHHTVAQVAAGASIGVIAACVALPLWMGPGWIGQRFGLKPEELRWMSWIVPEEGWSLYGKMAERVAEDLAFVMMECWELKALDPAQQLITQLSGSNKGY